jgi:hypothetical protein
MLKTVSQSSGGTISGVVYQGTWNASTNTPTLVSGVGTKGYYYVVSVAGNTNLDGVTLWGVGDWAVFNGTVWQKVDGGDTSAVTSLTVTGLTGYMYANNSSPVTASLTIPNSGLANNSSTIGNTVVTLGSTVTSLGNLTLANVTIQSGRANLTSANIAYSGTISTVGSLSVGGDIGGGSPDTGLLATFVGSANSYVYLLAQNTNNNSSAYTTYTVATNDYSSYANFGINNNAYNNGPANAFGVAKNAYFYSNNGDAVFGTYSNNAVHIIANGTTANADAITVNANNTVVVNNVSTSNITITGGTANLTTFRSTSNTAANATFSSATMMLIPAGYMIINLNGTNVKVPYYAV